MRLQRIMFLGILAVFVWLVAFSCKAPIIDDSFYITYISGVVWDSSSGIGIESAMIYVNDTIEGYLVLSDSLGHFQTYGSSLGKKYRGTYRIFCRKAAYVGKTDSVYSTPEHRRFDSVNFLLTRE